MKARGGVIAPKKIQDSCQRYMCNHNLYNKKQSEDWIKTSLPSSSEERDLIHQCYKLGMYCADHNKVFNHRPCDHPNWSVIQHKLRSIDQTQYTILRNTIQIEILYTDIPKMLLRNRDYWKIDDERKSANTFSIDTRGIDLFTIDQMS